MRGLPSPKYKRPPGMKPAALATEAQAPPRPKMTNAGNRLPCTLGVHDYFHGLNEYVQVEQKAVILDVVQIVLKLFN